MNRRQIWEEMRAAAERNRQQITGQPPRSRPPSRPTSRPSSPPRSQPASCLASPPQSRPASRPASRPTSRPHSPPSLEPFQAAVRPSAAPHRHGLPPRAQPGPALPSGRVEAPDQPAATPAAHAAAAATARAAVVPMPAQHANQVQHAVQLPAEQGQAQGQGHVAAVPSALQQPTPSHVRTPAVAPASQQPLVQQPLQQPPSPGGPEMLHQVEFVLPVMAKDGPTPGAPTPGHGKNLGPRVAELQTAGGQENGSGGSLEGFSELQPIPKLTPRTNNAAAEEEDAEYGQMVQEMQQVAVHGCIEKMLACCHLKLV